MKIKIWSKQAAKWWGSDKNVTWAVQNGEDWWLLKPENKKLPPSETTSKRKRGFTLRLLVTVALLGASLGIAAIYIWLLIKNA